MVEHLPEMPVAGRLLLCSRPLMLMVSSKASTVPAAYLGVISQIKLFC
jgi:hypothetical protein